MTPMRWPHPSERGAEKYRRAHELMDREWIGRVERAGFGSRRGYRGAYADRAEYRMPRGRLERDEPAGSGWPRPIREVGSESEERHLRAFRDRDLARSVDFALYNVIGRDADRIAVYAADAVITLEGVVANRYIAREALETAWSIPGVRRVKSRLGLPRRGR